MFARRNAWKIPFVLAAVFAVSACQDTTDPDPEPEIATLQLTVGTQTVTVATNPGCAVTGGPISLPINTTVALSASFRTESGEADPIANDPDTFRLSGSDGGAEPAPTPATIVWTRTGPFAGTLRGSVAASGSVQFSAFHLEEGHEDWGPCTVPITVTP